jgi:hypothetical protein
MKRLTKQWGNNPAVPTEFDIDCAFDMDNETWAKLCEIFNRLAAYEDSGLSPEEVQALAKAKEERRLVELPCKEAETALLKAREQDE